MTEISNGLTEAIMGFNPGGMGTQLSQVTTIFNNLRWYLVSNMRQPLSQAYAELGLVRTIVDVPVEDGMRGGVDIKSKILSPEEIEELKFVMEQEDDIGVMGKGLKWNRLFGGGGVLILTDQDPAEPLDINLIQENTPLEFRAVDMWELYWDKQNVEGDGSPLDNDEFQFYRYYGVNVHKSRVMVMKGLEAPSFIRPRLRGWGLSEIEILVRSVNQYLKANDLTFEILDEFKLDIFKIKNLTSTLLTPQGTDQVKRRIQLANHQKNYQNALTMDSEDDYIQKQLSFAGLAETQKEIRIQAASDLRMPITKVFGISAAGFSSGEDDIENYNSMVESSIRAKCKHHIITMIKLRCQQRFGAVPEDITVEFKPLRILSTEQEENVKTQKYNRLMSAVTAGLMTVKEFKDACNKDNLLGVSLDTSVEEISIPANGDGEEDAVPSKSAPSSTTKAPEAKT